MLRVSRARALFVAALLGDTAHALAAAEAPAATTVRKWLAHRGDVTMLPSEALAPDVCFQGDLGTLRGAEVYAAAACRWHADAIDLLQYRTTLLKVSTPRQTAAAAAAPAPAPAAAAAAAAAAALPPALPPAVPLATPRRSPRSPRTRSSSGGAPIGSRTHSSGRRRWRQHCAGASSVSTLSPSLSLSLSVALNVSYSLTVTLTPIPTLTLTLAPTLAPP